MQGLLDKGSKPTGYRKEFKQGIRNRARKKNFIHHNLK